MNESLKENSFSLSFMLLWRLHAKETF